MFGMHWLQISELNDELRANGLATFSSLHYTYGGGGYGVIGSRFIVGGEGHGFSQEASTGTYVQRLSGGFGFFNLGYILLEQWGFRVFPLAGIGGGGLTLRISQIANHTWDDIMDPTSFEEVQVSTGGFLAHLGAGLDYRLRLGEHEEGEGGLLLGVRAGYTVPFSRADWSMGSQNVIGGPNIGVEGLYLRFVIGGWGREKGR
ncbi:MAG: hypothetical protein ACOC8N_03870 [Spirochaetota bacterium]